MARRAYYQVLVDGRDITAILDPVLISLSVTDKAGTHSDTCSLELDDTDSRLIMPKKAAPIVIRLGWLGGTIAEVFNGKVDEVRSRRSRGGGQTLSIEGKGFDTTGKAKQQQSLHMDDMTLEQALRKAGQAAGVTDIRVAPALASIHRDSWVMDAESFAAFGQRLARELGGTFKLSNNRAVMAQRNSGQTPGGATLPTVIAALGDNLIDWDISPDIGRPQHREVRGRYYDRAAARWRDVRVQVPNTEAQAGMTRRNTSADRDEAQSGANSDRADAERNKGEGSVTIDGDVRAKAEGTCQLVGTRPGIDGSYKIDGVEHSLSRSDGWTTKLTIKMPSGAAGRDNRRVTGSGAPAGASASPGLTGRDNSALLGGPTTGGLA